MRKTGGGTPWFIPPFSDEVLPGSVGGDDTPDKVINAPSLGNTRPGSLSLHLTQIGNDLKQLPYIEFKASLEPQIHDSTIYLPPTRALECPDSGNGTPRLPSKSRSYVDGGPSGVCDGAGTSASVVKDIRDAILGHDFARIQDVLPGNGSFALSTTIRNAHVGRGFDGRAWFGWGGSGGLRGGRRQRG